MNELFPLFLRLADKRVLVVGAGVVAERKIEDLVDAGARVVVVAKEATPAVRQMTAVELHLREFEATDVEGAWLVIAATNSPETQRAVCLEADRLRVFSIAIDDPPNGTAYSASVVRRAPFTIAISSRGEAPALTRLLREVLEQALPDEEWVEAARELRAKWKAEGTPMASRFAELVRAFKSK